MEKRILIVVLVFFASSIFIQAEKVAVLKDLLKPIYLAIDHNQIYVTDGAKIHVYALKDYKKKFDFGKAGEGPTEFKLMPGQFPMVFSQEKNLVINSVGRVSFFTREGKFIKEFITRSTQFQGMYQPVKDGFVGMGFGVDREKQQVCLTIDFYNHKMEKIKEIFSIPFMSRRGMEFPVVNPQFFVRNNRIIMGGSDKLIINILNLEGEKLSSLTHKYKHLEITDSYKKKVMLLFSKLIPKDRLAILKNLIKFKKIFPAIQQIFVDNRYVYAMTYLERGEETEFIIFDITKGTSEKKMLPVQYIDIRVSPLAFKGGYLYQVISNEETEYWDLHRIKVK